MDEEMAIPEGDETSILYRTLKATTFTQKRRLTRTKIGQLMGMCMIKEWWYHHCDHPLNADNSREVPSGGKPN